MKLLLLPLTLFAALSSCSEIGNNNACIPQLDENLVAAYSAELSARNVTNTVPMPTEICYSSKQQSEFDDATSYVDDFYDAAFSLVISERILANVKSKLNEENKKYKIQKVSNAYLIYIYSMSYKEYEYNQKLLEQLTQCEPETVSNKSLKQTG